jgi:ribosome-binding protein aMBF1 (putative translation factor)
MKFKEFFETCGINKTKLAADLELNLNTIYGYMSGKWKPSQEAAERIEKYTGGRVTVMEMRGKDDRRTVNSASS